MKKVQTTNKTKGLFGFLTTLALAIGVGISLAPREAVRTQAVDATVELNSIGTGTTDSSSIQQTTVGDYVLNYKKGKPQKDGDDYAMLLTKSANAFVGNKTPIPGHIKSVKLDIASTASDKTSYYVRFASTEFTSEGSGGTAVVIKKSTSHTFNNTKTAGDFYFAVALGNAKNGQVMKITITYEAPALKTLESIDVTKQPSKKTYYVGDIFDKTDMEVTAYYDDDTEDIVSNDDVTVTPNVMSLDVTSVEVDYQGEKATITGISVEPAPTVESLEVTGTLVKSEYVEGTTFDPTGLVVTAHLSNSTTLNVTSLATYSPSPLAMGTTEVTISYGGKSASVSVTVTEFVAQVGIYNITSNVTSGSGYDANPSLEKFIVTKTNPDQEIFVLGDKENLRVGARPNVTEIMLGGPSAAGKVSFTMPVGVYVTSITLHDLQVADGAITVNANGGTNVSLSNNSTRESLVFNVYTNKVTLNTSKRLWINSISIETALVRGAAEHYANLFLDGTHAECLAGSVKAKTWNDLGDIFIGMDWAVIEQFESVVANAGGSILEQHVARYTYIGEKYGYDDFMDLGLVQSSIDRTVNKISDNSNLITITVLIGIIGLTTIAGYYFLQKKKHA